MFDSLLEQDPDIQRLRAESAAKGKIEGKVEGKVEGMQSAVIDFVSVRFPALSELARQKVTQVNNPDRLAVLVRQVATVPDENTARWLLDSQAA